MCPGSGPCDHTAINGIFFMEQTQNPEWNGWPELTQLAGFKRLNAVSFWACNFGVMCLLTLAFPHGHRRFCVSCPCHLTFVVRLTPPVTRAQAMREGFLQYFRALGAKPPKLIPDLSTVRNASSLLSS